MTAARPAPFTTAARLLCALLLAAVAGSAFWYGLSLIYFGDDLYCVYWGAHRMARDPLLWPVKLPAIFWFNTNGRMANFLAMPLLTLCPQWLVSALSALMTALFYGLALRMSAPLRRPAAVTALRVGLIAAVIAFAFPWWDQFCLFDVALNYVWAAALAMAFLLVWLRGVTSPWALAGGCLLGLVGGSMHEAMGVPMAMALVVALALPSCAVKAREGKRIPLTAAWLLGALVPLTSPGIWLRFGSGDPPDDPLPALMLKSCFIGFILLAVVAAMLCSGGGRGALRGCSASPLWLVCALTATASMAFVAAGGIVGRSGWFVETFALLALAQMVPAARQSWPGTVAAALLVAAVAAQLFALAAVQSRLRGEVADYMARYMASPDGIVFGSPVRHAQLPPLLMSRNSTVPDADDHADLLALARCVHPADRLLIVLPAELADSLTPAFQGPAAVPGRGTLSRTPPPARLQPVGIAGRGAWRAANGDEVTDSITIPFRRNGVKFFWTEPRESDPGQRYRVK